MKNENLIHTSTPLISKTVPGLLATVLICLVLLVTGYSIGKSSVSRTMSIAMNTQSDNHDAVAASPPKAKFILLVHNDDTPPTDPMQQVKEYSDWLAEIKATRVASGEHLKDKGWILQHDNTTEPNVREQSDFAGRNEVGGYFSFEADDVNDAIVIARTCPHLRYKGTLELREILPH